MVATSPDPSAEVRGADPHDLDRRGDHSPGHDRAVAAAVVRVLRADDRERAAVADLLHEQPVQLLTAVGIRLGTLARNGGDAAGVSDELQERIDRAIAQLRRMMRNLRELDPDDGLSDVLRRELDDVGRTLDDTPTSLEDQRLDGRASPGTTAVLLRIGRAVFDVLVRASAPTAIAVRLAGTPRISCSIVVTGADPTGLQAQIEHRLEPWFGVLADLGGSWSFRTNPSALSFTVELPAGL